MKALTKSFAWRGLALAGLVSLAACQTPPQQGGAAPAAGAAGQQAAQSQQRPQQQAPQQAANSAPVVAMYLAQPQPAEGLAQIQLNQTTRLYTVRQPVFTQADLQQIVPVQNKEGQVFLRFDFNQQGAAKLAKVTGESVGKYLLVSVRGKLVAVPRIAAANTAGQLPVAVKSADEARAIVQLLRQPAAGAPAQK